METEIIKALADLPLTGILVYLLIRQQAQIEKLLVEFANSEREHARNIVDLITHRSIPQNGNVSREAQVSNN